MINHIKVMELFKYLLISIPMISAMTCGIIFMVVFHKSLSVTENKIRQTLGSYYILMIILWFITNVTLEHYHGKLYLIPIFFLLIHLTQVAFYHFVCFIVPSKEKFNTVHYKISVAIFIMTVSLVYVLITTKGYQQLDVVYFFSQFMYIYTSLNMAYYTTLCLIRLYRYNKEAKKLVYEKLKFNWIHILLILRTVFSILFIFNNNRILIIDITLVLLIPTQHIILTYNVLHKKIIDRIRTEYKTNIMLASGQIVSIDNSGLINNVGVSNNYLQNESEPNSLLTQQDIIDYFSKDKPYLNKDFKLDDLVKHFGVNRSYISKFINVTFNSNVSQFINQWRLKEIEYLQKNQNNTNIEDLSIMAGFSNYRHYLRAKKSFEKI